MSTPFVIVAGPGDPCHQHSESAEGKLLEAGWEVWKSRPGLTVWQRPGRPLPLQAEVSPAEIIVGRYRRSRTSPRATVARQKAVGSRAKALADEGWGGYLALLRDPGDDRWWVFRDPSGAVEAFTWRLGRMAICVSGLADLPLGFLPARLGLDWRLIADCLHDPAALGGRPPLAGVHAITAGDVQPLGGSADEAIAIWRPRHWASAASDQDPGWTRQLSETLMRTVAAMVEPYARVATEASGGLDSSIVNAAIAQAGLGDRVVAALHYVGDRPEADERKWAQALCDLLKLPLDPVDRPQAMIDVERDFAPLARDIRPPLAALDTARDLDTAARLGATGAQALLTGKGGDALFFQMPTPWVLADLWQARKGAAWRHPLNAQVARWLRRSIWSVWRDALLRQPAAPPPPLGRFAGPALRDVPRARPHPWLTDLEGTPPAKRIQIRALTSGQIGQGVTRRGQVADILHPLLTQPVMELCLSIPTWQLVRGGRDRALAREAFAGWLPPSIAQRRSKGGLSSWYARHVAASAEALSAYLRDGVLVDAGLLDRAAVEAALDPDDLILTGDAVDLIAAAAVEAWVRHWQGRAPDAAGAERRQL